MRSFKTSAQSSLSSRKHRSTYTSNYLARNLRTKLKEIRKTKPNFNEEQPCK